MSNSFLRANTAWGLITLRADKSPDATMLIDAAGKRMTFKEFVRAAEQTAAGLLALGIGPGVEVAWQLPTCIDTIVLCAALTRLGAIQYPILHLYREREVGFILRMNQLPYFIVRQRVGTRDYRAMAETVIAQLDTPPRLLVLQDGLPKGDPANLPPPPESGEDVRWIYHTSGTTSEPKGVRHTDSTLMAGGRFLAWANHVTASDVGAIVFPFTHIGGPDFLFVMLSTGMPAVVMESFVPSDAVQVFRRLGVTWTGGSTAFYVAFLQEQRKQPGQPILPDLRILTGGGAAKPPELFFQVQEEMGCKIVHAYGMTEAPMIISNSPSDTDEQLAYSDGAVAEGMEMRIVGPDGMQVPTGTIGEITIKGEILFKGYTNPEDTAAAFDKDGFFHTGDLGFMREDGHVSLTGRLKDIIIRKGENIAAQELEAILFGHPKVRAAAVIGLPDPIRGERVCAVVELREGAEPLTFQEMVKSFEQANIMTQKIPEQLEIVDKLPRNETFQKILKFKLREQFAQSEGKSPNVSS